MSADILDFEVKDNGEVEATGDWGDYFMSDSKGICTVSYLRDLDKLNSMGAAEPQPIFSAASEQECMEAAVKYELALEQAALNNEELDINSVLPALQFNVNVTDGVEWAISADKKTSYSIERVADNSGDFELFIQNLDSRFSDVVGYANNRFDLVCFANKVQREINTAEKSAGDVLRSLPKAY